MQIKTVIIKNFRLFKDTTVIEFGKNYTSLVGENGTGKTTILEAINIATSFYFVENKIGIEDFNDDNKEIEISIEFDNFFFLLLPDGFVTRRIPTKFVKLVLKLREKAVSGKAFSNPFVANHTIIPFEFKNTGELKLENTDNIPKSIYKKGDDFFLIQENDKYKKINPFSLVVSNNNLDGFPNIFYFPKNRDKDTKKGYSTTFQRIIDELNWRFIKELKKEDEEGVQTERANYVKNWETIYKSVIEKVDNPKQSKIIHPLKAITQDILGNKFENLEISLLNLKQPFQDSFFSLREEDKIIGLSKLGSGELMIITHFLLSLTIKLSKEEIISLIDEPEIHLHPQLQSKLLDEFKSAKYQIIYTTHSDILIDIANWQSLRRCNLEGKIFPNNKPQEVLDGKKIFEHLDEINIYHQHKSVFFREDNQLFFAKKCLLVEGPSEKYGIPVLSEKLGVNIDGITIVSCNGKGKVCYYQLLCKTYNIPYFTLFDLDNKNANQDDNERPYNWADTKAIFTFKTSFENLLGVGNNTSHKASKVLEKIDAIDAKDIPEEIISAIKGISVFSDN